jgi:hypothetical protein
MICLIEPVTPPEPAPAIRCFDFQLRPGGCLCDGMAKLRYPSTGANVDIPVSIFTEDATCGSLTAFD